MTSSAKKITFFLLITCMMIVGCSKNDGDEKKDPTRTVLVYMIADNNLDDDALIDIIEMENNWDPSYKGNLLVFFNSTGGVNTLYHIQKEESTSEILSPVVKVYPAGSEVCTESFLRQVITDVMALYPADSYGLDLWSHGRGWLPENQKSPLTVSDTYSKYFHSDEIAVPKTVSEEFGYERENEGYFEVYDLADALSPFYFDFIFMDACHMGTIECAYEMRNLCDYYISSAAETMVDGAPYDLITGDMFAQPVNAVAIAQKFYEYYNQQIGSRRTATISVVKTDELENVASELKDVVTANPNVPFSTIQQFGRSVTNMDDCLFDLEDFVIQTWGSSTSAQFSSALTKAVIYKAATPMILNTISVDYFSGLSCYIPKSGQTNTYSIFKNYEWAEDSGLDKMVQ